MAIATLTIDIVAKLANLQTGFDRAAQLAERNANRIDKAFKSVGAALGTIGAGFGLQQIVQVFNNTADGLAKFKDVAEQTGIAVEELSKLEPVARGAGLQIDSVANLSLKLSKALSGVDDESRGAGKALAQIGIDLEKFRNLGAAEQMQALARALDQYADDANKAAIGQAILGKNWQQSANFLKDLADAGQLNATVTAEQARQADEYNKNVERLKGNLVDLARVLTGGVLPGLNRLFEGTRRIDWDKILRPSNLLFPARAFKELNEQAQRIGRELNAEELAKSADELERLFNLGGAGKPSAGAFTGAAESASKASKAVAELARITDDYAQSLRRAREVERERQGVEELNDAADAYRKLQEEVAKVADLTGRSQANRFVQDLALIDDYFFAGKISVEEYQVALEKLAGVTNQVAKATEETGGFARELGFTFSSALEDTIVNFTNLRDVLRGFEQDLIRIITRKLVSEPLANAVGGFDWGSIIGSLLGGARARGGPMDAGRAYLVGERGPEIVVPRQASSVIPNGGIARNTVINVNVPAGTSGATAQQIAASVARTLAIADARLN